MHPDVPDVAELCRELAAAAISSDLTRLLMSFRHGTWLTGVGAGLPVQVVHGDVAARLHELAAADKWLTAHGSDLPGLLRPDASAP